MRDLSELLSIDGVTDVHLLFGTEIKARIRKDGDLSLPEQINVDIPGISIWAEEEEKSSLSFENSRLRLTYAKQVDGERSLFIRVLPNKALPIEKVGGRYFFERMTENDYSSGLILVSGKVGSGKSTFIASILQHYITTCPVHIVSIEDPVEYILTSKVGYATHKEIRKNSFAPALRVALREDPDIIYIGEVRDRETAEIALTAAESGHLVFGTIHSGSNAGVPDRLMGLVGNSEYIAQRISQCLKLCLHTKRHCSSFEYIYAEISDSLRNIIRNRQLHQWGSYVVEIHQNSNERSA